VPHVTTNFHATLRQHVGGKSSLEVAIEPGQTVAQLLRQLDVPVDQTRLVFCDNRHVTLSHVLKGGETVAVFPALGGG
jgi:molybdopterin converting factor small subunit